MPSNNHTEYFRNLNKDRKLFNDCPIDYLGQRVNAGEIAYNVFMCFFDRMLNDWEPMSDEMLTHYIPSYSDYCETSDWFDTDAGHKKEVAYKAAMRQSLAELKELVRVEVCVPGKGRSGMYTTHVEEHDDHVNDPCLKVSQGMFSIYRDGTQADIEHMLLRLLVSMAEQVGYLWFRFRVNSRGLRAAATRHQTQIMVGLCGGRTWLAEINEHKQKRLYSIVAGGSYVECGIISDLHAHTLILALLGEEPCLLPVPWFSPKSFRMTVAFNGEVSDEDDVAYTRWCTRRIGEELVKKKHELHGFATYKTLSFKEIFTHGQSFYEEEMEVIKAKKAAKAAEKAVPKSIKHFRKLDERERKKKLKADAKAAEKAKRRPFRLIRTGGASPSGSEDEGGSGSDCERERDKSPPRSRRDGTPALLTPQGPSSRTYPVPTSESQDSVTSNPPTPKRRSADSSSPSRKPVSPVARTPLPQPSSIYPVYSPSSFSLQQLPRKVIPLKPRDSMGKIIL